MIQPAQQKLDHAKLLLQQGRLQESEQEFRQVISSGQHTAAGLYGVGMVRLYLNDLDGAANHFQAALQQEPANANTVYQLGVVAEKRKLWDEARTFYHRALAINPQHQSAQNALASLPPSPAMPVASLGQGAPINTPPPASNVPPMTPFYGFNGNNPPPIGIAGNAGPQLIFPAGPSTADALYNAGVAQMNVQNVLGAESYFQQVLQYNPAHANALYYLGVIAQQQNNWHQAASYYQRALAVNSQHKGAQQALMQVAHQVAAMSPGSPVPQGGLQAPAIQSPAQAVPSIVMPQKYGAYEHLRDDRSMLAQNTLTVIDALRTNKTHPSFTAYLDVFVPCLIGCCFLLLFVISILGAFNMHSPLWIAGAVIFGLTMLWGIRAIWRGLVGYLTLITTEFVVDKGRLQVKKGIFAKTLHNYELLRVHDIQLRQTFLNRFTGDGTLIFQIERETQPIEIKGLVRGKRLHEVYQQLLNLVSLLRFNPTPKGIIQ